MSVEGFLKTEQYKSLTDCFSHPFVLQYVVSERCNANMMPKSDGIFHSFYIFDLELLSAKYKHVIVFFL